VAVLWDAEACADEGACAAPEAWGVVAAAAHCPAHRLALRHRLPPVQVRRVAPAGLLDAPCRHSVEARARTSRPVRC
jgi:hypothetical protein